MPILRQVACAISLQVSVISVFSQQRPTVAPSSEHPGLLPLSCISGSTLPNYTAGSSNGPTLALSSNTVALLAPLSSQQFSKNSVTPECAPPTPPTDPEASVSYQAFIPQDHISGPAPNTCSLTTGYIYLGDRLSDPIHANPNSFRATQLVYLFPNSGISQNPYSTLGNGTTGYTEQFYLPSPVNGQYITDSDYDGKAGDCYEWTGDAQAHFGQNGNSASVTATPGGHNIVLNLAGNSTNPLQQPSIGAIRWNVSVTVNKTTGNSTHVFVSGAVSCYPSHKVVVNGTQVGFYNAPLNPGINYISSCLIFNGPSTPLQGPGTTSGGATVLVY